MPNPKIVPLETYNTETGEVIGERLTPEQLTNWRLEEIHGAEMLQWKLAAEQWFSEDRNKVKEFLLYRLEKVKDNFIRILDASYYKFVETQHPFAISPDELRQAFEQFYENVKKYSLDIIIVLDNLFEMVNLDSNEQDIKQTMANSIAKWISSVADFKNFSRQFFYTIKPFFTDKNLIQYTEEKILKDFHRDILKIFKKITFIAPSIRNIPYLRNYFNNLSQYSDSGEQSIDTKLQESVDHLLSLFKLDAAKKRIVTALCSAYINKDYWDFTKNEFDEFVKVVKAAKKNPMVLKVYLSMKKTANAEQMIYWNLFKQGLLQELPILKNFL